MFTLSRVKLFLEVNRREEPIVMGVYEPIIEDSDRTTTKEVWEKKSLEKMKVSKLRRRYVCRSFRSGYSQRKSQGLCIEINGSPVKNIIWMSNEVKVYSSWLHLLENERRIKGFIRTIIITPHETYYYHCYSLFHMTSVMSP